MDRRTLLALLLTAIVIVATPFIFPGPRRTRPLPADTTKPVARDTTPPAAPATPEPTPLQTPKPTNVVAAAARAETTVVRTDRGTFVLLSPGGTPANVTLPEYRSLRPGASRSTAVTLVDPSDRLIRLRLAGARDTIALDTVAFQAGPQRREGGSIVQVLTSTSSAPPVTLTYRFPVDSFVAYVDGSIGTVTGQQAQAWHLLVSLPSRIRSDEADVKDDTRHLSVAYRVRNSEVTTVAFRQLDTLATRVDTGSFRWVAMRNKYFVVAAIPEGRDSVFRTVVMRGGPRTGPEPTAAHAMAVLPTSADRFTLKLYAGPQSWDHLRRAAPDLENVNPYGGWLHGIVQPFATIVMRLLLWLHNTLKVGYGWVLVIFAVAVRLLMWPMNQSAMRNSMKLQRIQPEMAELQKKYRNDPEKQRDAMLKLYQAHGMSPFSPILGCLPMLLPMPILYALYFVFQNTIELRGVSFLWLPDLSLKDPFFITPLFMGITMFVMSWIGMRGMPPSPQGKMMSYVMPAMFTALFWNFASGLNLYYAVQNVAALPQQWLLSREKLRAQPAQPAKSVQSTPAARKAVGGGGKGTRNEGS